jgi:colicin import membrane protein
MAQIKATYPAVIEAIDKLKLAGRSVTIASIQSITGGSNSTITLLKRRFESERPTILAAKSINLNPEISALIVSEITRAAHEASTDATQKLAEAEIDMTRVSEEAEATAAALDTKEVELEAARSQAQALAGQIEQLKTDADQIKQSAITQIKIAEDRADRERTEREAAQVAIARADLRLEALPRLENEISRLTEELRQERTARTASDQTAAVALARLEGEQAAHSDAQRREQAAVDKLDKLEKQAAATAQELVSARFQVQAQQSGLDAAARELNDLRKQIKEVRDQSKKDGEIAAELRGRLAAIDHVEQQKEENSLNKHQKVTQ